MDTYILTKRDRLPEKNVELMMMNSFEHCLTF